MSAALKCCQETKHDSPGPPSTARRVAIAHSLNLNAITNQSTFIAGLEATKRSVAIILLGVVLEIAPDLADVTAVEMDRVEENGFERIAAFYSATRLLQSSLNSLVITSLSMIKRMYFKVI